MKAKEYKIDKLRIEEVDNFIVIGITKKGDSFFHVHDDEELPDENEFFVALTTPLKF